MTKKSNPHRIHVLAALGLTALAGGVVACTPQNARESLGSTAQAVKNGKASSNGDVVVLYSLGVKFDGKWTSKDVHGSAVRLCPDVLLTVSHVAANVEGDANARVATTDKVFGAWAYDGLEHEYYFVDDSGIAVDQIAAAYSIDSYKLPPKEATKTIKTEGFHLLHLNKPLPGAGGAPLPKADAAAALKKGDRATLVGYGFGSGKDEAALDGVRREGEISYLESVMGKGVLFVPPAMGGAFGAKNDSGGGVFLNVAAKNKTLFGLEAAGYFKWDAKGNMLPAPYNGENDLVLPLTAEVITAIEKVIAEKKWCQAGLTRPVAMAPLPPENTAVTLAPAPVTATPTLAPTSTTTTPTLAPTVTTTPTVAPTVTTTPTLAPTVTTTALPGTYPAPVTLLPVAIGPDPTVSLTSYGLLPSVTASGTLAPRWMLLETSGDLESYLPTEPAPEVGVQP